MALSIFFAAACAAQGLSEPASPASVVHVEDGVCAGARPIDAEGHLGESAREVGELARYRVPLFITEERVRVRASAMWSGEDHRNVIGTTAGRRWVLGHGPLTDAEVRSGIGYAVVVEDASGERCRGYLSLTVLQPGS